MSNVSAGRARVFGIFAIALLVVSMTFLPINWKGLLVRLTTFDRWTQLMLFEAARLLEVDGREFNESKIVVYSVLSGFTYIYERRRPDGIDEMELNFIDGKACLMRGRLDGSIVDSSCVDIRVDLLECCSAPLPPGVVLKEK